LVFRDKRAPASEVVPKFISPSDPAAQWTGAHKGPAFFAYSDNHLIDVKFGVIVDVEASRAIRQAEVGAACWRYRLRRSSHAELADRGKGYRATYSRVQQIETRRRHLLARRLPI
jgi:hypothetical protein